jgi:hypothetical protein
MDDTSGPDVVGARRSCWPWIAGAAAVVLVGVVAFGYFGVHTLFVDDVVDEAGPVFDSGASADALSEPAPDEPVDLAPASTTVPREPEIVTLASGSFEGRGRYSGTGTAVVLTDGTDQRFLRFEDDFATDNGPDLFVFLGTGSGAYGDPAQYVELGVLTGNIGAQNYEIPPTHPVTGEPIDLDMFSEVAVWCRRFDSTFAVATLS